MSRPSFNNPITTCMIPCDAIQIAQNNESFIEEIWTALQWRKYLMDDDENKN